MKNIVYIIAFLSVSAVLRHFIFPGKPTPQELESAVIEAFKKASDDLNMHGSRMLDEETRFDKTEVGPGARMTYYYTLIRYTSKDEKLKSLREPIDNKLWEGVCKNEAMRKATLQGGKYIYIFSGIDNEEFQSFEYGKVECLQARVIKVQK